MSCIVACCWFRKAHPRTVSVAYVRKHNFRHLNNYELNPCLMWAVCLAYGACSLHFSGLNSMSPNASLRKGSPDRGHNTRVHVCVHDEQAHDGTLVTEVSWGARTPGAASEVRSRLSDTLCCVCVCGVFAAFRNHFQIIIPNY